MFNYIIYNIYSILSPFPLIFSLFTFNLSLFSPLISLSL